MYTKDATLFLLDPWFEYYYFKIYIESNKWLGETYTQTCIM